MIPSPAPIHTNLRGKPWSHLQEALKRSENQWVRAWLQAEGSPGRGAGSAPECLILTCASAPAAG